MAFVFKALGFSQDPEISPDGSQAGSDEPAPAEAINDLNEAPPPTPLPDFPSLRDAGVPAPSAPLCGPPSNPTVLTKWLQQDGVNPKSPTYQFAPVGIGTDYEGKVSYDKLFRMTPPHILLELHKEHEFRLDLTACDLGNVFCPSYRRYFHEQGLSLNGCYTTAGHNTLHHLDKYLSLGIPFMCHPNYYNRPNYDNVVGGDTVTDWANAFVAAGDAGIRFNGWFLLHSPEADVESASVFLLDFRRCIQRLRKYVDCV